MNNPFPPLPPGGASPRRHYPVRACRALPRSQVIAEDGDLSGVLTLVTIGRVDNEIVQCVLRAVPGQCPGFAESSGGDTFRLGTNAGMRRFILREHIPWDSVLPERHL